MPVARVVQAAGRQVPRAGRQGGHAEHHEAQESKDRERTHATIVRLLKETRLTPAAHLTCVDATVETMQSAARCACVAGRGTAGTR